MYRISVIVGIILISSVCNAFSEISWWTVSTGKERVIEFISEDIKLYCHGGCHAYTVAGRPDEIYVSPLSKDALTGLRQGKVEMSHSPKVGVLNVQSRALALMELDRFLKLDILFEDFPVRDYEKHPEIKYGGNPEGHNSVSPILRNGKEFVATLSSVRKTSERTTFGIPGIIPFFGRSTWFEKEKSLKGTFFLEIFDREHPTKPIVQLQKTFNDIWLLPSVFEMASWTQGAKEPFLVVADHENPIREKRVRILVFRLP
jgi:hypothetical protein